MLNTAVLFTVAGILYMTPTIIALLRRKRNWFPILLTNLFLGWTLIFWFGVLIWSLLSDS